MVFPAELGGVVEEVYLARDGFCFGESYRGARHQDIIVLKLKQIPAGMVEDETNVLVWHDDCGKDRVENGVYVAGHSLKSNVTGRNAVFQETEPSQNWLPFFPRSSDRGYWIAYMTGSPPEEGHSGTVMFGFTKEKGSEYILGGGKAEKPRIMGVYTGTFQLDGLRDRLTICPIRPIYAFDSKPKVDHPPIFTLTQKGKSKGSWKAGGKRDEFVMVDPSKRISLHGVFIESEYADSATKIRLQNSEEYQSRGPHKDHKRLVIPETQQEGGSGDDCQCVIL